MPNSPVFASAKRRWLLPVLALGLLVTVGAGDSARVGQLGHQMMCVCGCNQILLECNHVGCAYSSRMRTELISAVDRGDNDNNVLQWFVQTYGTTVLATPTNSGFNRVAWIMPYVALAGGITLVVTIILVWKKRPLAVPPGVATPRRGVDLDRFREQARRETDL